MGSRTPLASGRAFSLASPFGRATFLLVPPSSCDDRRRRSGTGGTPFLPHPVAQRRAAAPAESAVRVLIVEDNPDGREALQALLESWGHEVEAAEDGQQGVDKALAWRPDAAVV